MCSGFWPVRRDLALSCYSFRRRPGAVIEAGLGAGPAPSAYPFPRYSLQSSVVSWQTLGLCAVVLTTDGCFWG